MTHLQISTSTALSLHSFGPPAILKSTSNMSHRSAWKDSQHNAHTAHTHTTTHSKQKPYQLKKTGKKTLSTSQKNPKFTQYLNTLAYNPRNSPKITSTRCQTLSNLSSWQHYFYSRYQSVQSGAVWYSRRNGCRQRRFLFLH